MRKLFGIFSAVLLAGSLAACGGDSMPSRSDMISGFDKLSGDSFDQFEGAGESAVEAYESMRDCIVDEVIESDNSELGKLIADGDPEATGSKEAQNELTEITSACISKVAGVPDTEK